MQESPYVLPGPVRAGTWKVELSDYFPAATDYVAHAQLVRRVGANDTLIVEMDVHVIGTPSMAPKGQGSAMAPAVPANRGDQLVLKIEIRSGLSPGDATPVAALVYTP